MELFQKRSHLTVFASACQKAIGHNVDIVYTRLFIVRTKADIQGKGIAAFPIPTNIVINHDSNILYISNILSDPDIGYL